MLGPMHEDGDNTWTKTLAIGFVTGLLASVATEAGKWLVEEVRSRVKKAEK